MSDDLQNAVGVRRGRRRRHSVGGAGARDDAGGVHRRRQHVLPGYHTIDAVAQALDVSARTVRRWIGTGDLAVVRIGGVIRIADVDLRAFLAAHREG